MGSFCEQLQRQLLDAAGDPLTERERTHLRSCEECGTMYDDISAIGPELAQIAKQTDTITPVGLRPELKDAVRARIRAAFAAEAPGVRTVALGQRPRRSPAAAVADLFGRWTPAIRWAAVAAAIAVVAAIGYHQLSLRRPVGKLEFASGTISVTTDSGARQLSGIAELRCRRASRLRTPEGASGLFSLGNNVRGAVAGSTELAMRGPDEVVLYRGSVWFRVLPKGKGFSVSTPNGIVRVTGTSFGVTADRQETRVDVTDGTVGVSQAGSTAAVSAGQTLRADADGVSEPSPRREKTGLPAWVTRLLSEEKKAHAGQYVPSIAIE